MIYPTLYTKIETILNGISEIREVYDHPTPNLDKYPAAMFFPTGMENSFETTEDNMKVYTWKVFLIIGTRQKSVSEIMRNTMPKLVDAFLQAVDDGWSFDAIDGHRVWTKVEAGSWSVSDEVGGLEVTSEFDLSVKLLTSNN